MAISPVGSFPEQFGLSPLSLFPPRSVGEERSAALAVQLDVARKASAAEARPAGTANPRSAEVEPLASPGDVPVRFGASFGHKRPGGPVQLSPELTALSMTLQQTVNVAIPLNGFAGPAGLLQIGLIVNVAA
ncbi:MAG: hypothetical protein CL878_05925 [Dehalococcoidia bacterium]|nr:hypothetical protein [Dehalococcoidia bacterium]